MGGGPSPWPSKRVRKRTKYVTGRNSISKLLDRAPLVNYISSLFPLRRCRLNDALTPERKISVQFEKRHQTMFATLDGSLGHLLPVSEKVYRRLLMLQNVLNQHTQHLAGLNPKAFRWLRVDKRSLLNANRCVALSTFRKSSTGDLSHLEQYPNQPS